MRDRQFKGLRQEHADAVAAHKSVALQHIGETAGIVCNLVKRRARRGAALIDIDQCEPFVSIGMAVAAGCSNVEARWDIPAEVAVELVIIGSFGEHGVSLNLTSSALMGKLASVAGG